MFSFQEMLIRLLALNLSIYMFSNVLLYPFVSITFFYLVTLAENLQQLFERYEDSALSINQDQSILNQQNIQQEFNHSAQSNRQSLWASDEPSLQQQNEQQSYVQSQSRLQSQLQRSEIPLSLAFTVIILEFFDQSFVSAMKQTFLKLLALFLISRILNFTLFMWIIVLILNLFTYYYASEILSPHLFPTSPMHTIFIFKFQGDIIDITNKRAIVAACIFLISLFYYATRHWWLNNIYAAMFTLAVVRYQMRVSQSTWFFVFLGLLICLICFMSLFFEIDLDWIKHIKFPLKLLFPYAHKKASLHLFVIVFTHYLVSLSNALDEAEQQLSRPKMRFKSKLYVQMKLLLPITYLVRYYLFRDNRVYILFVVLPLTCTTILRKIFSLTFIDILFMTNNESSEQQSQQIERGQ